MTCACTAAIKVQEDNNENSKKIWLIIIFDQILWWDYNEQLNVCHGSYHTIKPNRTIKAFTSFITTLYIRRFMTLNQAQKWSSVVRSHLFESRERWVKVACVYCVCASHTDTIGMNEKCRKHSDFTSKTFSLFKNSSAASQPHQQVSLTAWEGHSLSVSFTNMDLQKWEVYVMIIRASIYSENLVNETKAVFMFNLMSSRLLSMCIANI